MACTFEVLGPMRVLVDDIDLTPRAPKERSLLALLVMNAGRVVSSDRIIDELWGRLPVDQARRVLWVRIAGLRKLFKRAGAASLLDFASSGYRLAVASEDVDAHRFLVLVDEARGQRERGDTSAAADTLGRALALWRGDALADAQGCVSLESEARRLTDARLDATEEWVDGQLACGRHDAVVFELSRLADAHPLRERLCLQHASCLHRVGRNGEAMAACHALRTRLATELGLEPGPELARLEQEILGVAQEDASVARHDPTRVRHNLPIELTRFVGRRQELGEVTELLASYRLVTLTGVGGGGKTRLALEAVALLETRYRDGVYLVELSPVRSDDGVAAAVARALGVASAGSNGPDDGDQALLRSLTRRQLLLVIDTAEHVIGGVARLVHQVLTTCRDVSVLVTSREVLGVRGEAAFAVPPLTLPPPGATETKDLAVSDAVTLFCERARAARPGHALSAEDVAGAAKVCRRLDGIPLAIELAAARTRMLGIGQLAERLDDCFQLLRTDRASGVPARHQTLRATLDWSYELLAPAEKTALRHLGVFPADFDLDAAVAVLDGAPDREIDGFTAMSRLVDKSLVTVVEGGEHVRYRLLDPIRQYAAEKLSEAGEAESLRRLHRDVYLARQPTLWPLITAQKRQEAYIDRENFVSALEWSWRAGDATAALRLVAIQTSSWMSLSDAQACEWLERALAETGSLIHPARAIALTLLAISLQDAGAATSERVDELIREATAIAEVVGDPTELAACQLCEVEIKLARARIDEARALTHAALETYERLGLAAGVGWCHHFLGWVAVAGDDADGALVHFERALETARTAHGGEWLLAHALADLAPLVALGGDGTRGLRLAREAVAVARPFVVRAVLAMALARAAETAILADDLEAAGDALAELLTVLRNLGTRRWAADALELTAVVHERRGQHVDGALALSAARVLRAAAGEIGGGVRTVAAEVRHTEHRLRAVLGSERFAALDARGGAAPVESTMNAMVATLRLQPPCAPAERAEPAVHEP